MAIPLTYNVRCVKARWTSAIVAVIGIAGTVGVFVADASLARGFRATLVASGSPGNALVMRAGSTSEMMGGVTLDTVKIIQDAPGIARDSAGPLVTEEVVGVIPFPLISTGTNANVQVRGVLANVLRICTFVKIAQGRMFNPGLNELIVGKNANTTYSGLTIGNTVKFGGTPWQVVGVFDAGGSAFDSEVWCDGPILNQVLKRPPNIFQSVTVHLASPDTFQQFKDRHHGRPATQRRRDARDRLLREAVDSDDQADYHSRRRGGFYHGHWRRVRRAQHHVLRGRRAWPRNRHACAPWDSARSLWWLHFCSRPC